MWDLKAALDPRAPASTLCLRTLVVSYLLVFYTNRCQSFSVLVVSALCSLDVVDLAMASFSKCVSLVPKRFVPQQSSNLCETVINFDGKG